MTPGVSFCPGMERLQGESGESYCPRIERLQGSHTVLVLNDSRAVILFWDGTTPGESFSHGMERLQVIPSILGLNYSRGVFQY